MSLRYFFRSMAATAVVTFCTAVGAGAQEVPDGYPAEYASIIEGSRTEKELTLYTNASSALWEGLIKAFNEKYDWIKVQSLDIDSGEIVERHLAEAASGQNTGDILIHQSLDGWVNAMRRGAIEPYESPETPNIPAIANPGKGIYSLFIDPVLLVWNKLLVPEDLAPTSIPDLAQKVKDHPDVFGGKLATQGPPMSAAGYTNHYAYLAAHGEDGWNNLKSIGSNVRFESSIGPMMEKLLAGEYVVAYFVQQQPVLNLALDPAVVEVVGFRTALPEDGVPIVARSIAITKAAPNPNSAKLFLDFALSREGQIALGKMKLSVVRKDITGKDVDGTLTFADTIATIGEANLLSVGLSEEAVDKRSEFLNRISETYGTK